MLSKAPHCKCAKKVEELISGLQVLNKRIRQVQRRMDHKEKKDNEFSHLILHEESILIDELQRSKNLTSKQDLGSLLLPFRQELYRLNQTVSQMKGKIVQIPKMKANISIQTRIMDHFSKQLEELKAASNENPQESKQNFQIDFESPTRKVKGQEMKFSQRMKTQNQQDKGVLKKVCQNIAKIKKTDKLSRLLEYSSDSQASL